MTEKLSSPSSTHNEQASSLEMPKGMEHDIVELASDASTSKPSATTTAMFKLYAILSVGYFCIILQGYDGSLMGAINAMPQYLDYYGL